MLREWSGKCKRDGSRASHIHLQRGDEGLLRDVDLAELAHALFAFLLLVQKLALARYVAAVAFGGDVCASRMHSLAGVLLAFK